MKPRALHNRFFGLAVLLVGLGWSAAAAAKAETLSAADQAVYRAAFAAVAAEKWVDARKLAAQGKNPLPEKVIQWLDLIRPGPGRSFTELTQFIRDNPDWPRQETLQAQAERAMPAGLSDKEVLAWLQGREPRTLAGSLQLGQALLAHGSKDQAVAVIRRGWTDFDGVDAPEESAYLAFARSYLRPEEHLARLDRLLWDNRQDAVRRLMPLVDASHRALAEARLALRNEGPRVEALVAAVPASLARDPGLIYERARWRRRHDQFETIPPLFNPPLKDIARPELVWRELDDAARRALSRGEAKTAYRLASQHGGMGGTVFAEGEWLSGWIALRFLHDAKTAATHFDGLFDGVSSPISKARAAYWSGRARDAMKNKPEAQKWYQTAAQYSTTYYGQLAAQRAGHQGPLTFPATPEPSAADEAAFNKQELARVVQLLVQLGEGDRARIFLSRMVELAKGPAERRMIVDLAGSLGRDDLMVAAAKAARQEGTELVEQLFPLHSVPAGDSPEKALVLAIIRQESAFQEDAVSSAGALGLMQLMPATAKSVAKKLGLGYSPAKLTGDPSFNITLGRAYIDGLVGDYGGSYVLAIAGYNAGPRRVSEWMAQNRDPRRQGVDVVDWIESIPISETRNYVQRVMENLQVYRHRLGGTQLALSIEQDLAR
jgi:soluble lytic murein transglycosylase